MSRNALSRQLAMLVALAASLGCAPSPHKEVSKDEFDGSYPIRVVCTTGMVADIVREVGGNRVEVTQLMGEGVDPHLYKASPSDVAKLEDADLVVYSGLHLEGKLSEIFERMASRKPTYAIAEALPEDRILTSGNGKVDPHVWFDIMLWREGVKGFADKLSQYDPSGKETYQQNAEQYEKILAELDKEVAEKIATLPEDHRILVTAHDAFGYFARAYGMQVRAIQGISTESEAGLFEINALVDFLSKTKIKAVFVETAISDRNIRALVEGCKARGHDVEIGGELYSDAMGKPGTPDGTYPGMIRHNVDVIVRALK